MSAPSPEPSSDPAEFRRALGSWFDREARRLPWRVEPRVPYRSVVSELMLQQTRIATALPYFERWMRALPDFAALAAASEADVLKLWEGLGYYRRARLLHALARELVRLPEPPRTAAAWRGLPGIGPYTAAAIASMVFGEAVACVDGNVVRILARLAGEDRAFGSAAAAVKHFQPAADRLLDHKRPGRHNEAMMELGALVCTRGAPRCGVCPVAGFCVARRRSDAAALPRIARPATKRVALDRVWWVRDGRLLLHRAAPGDGRLAGLWELPEAGLAGLSPAEVRRAGVLGTIRRAITRHRITERILSVDTDGPRSHANAPGLEWVALGRLGGLAFSGPHRRWIDEHLAAGAATSGRGRASSRETAGRRRRRSD